MHIGQLFMQIKSTGKLVHPYYLVSTNCHSHSEKNSGKTQIFKIYVKNQISNFKINNMFKNRLLHKGYKSVRVTLILSGGVSFQYVHITRKGILFRM